MIGDELGLLDSTTLILPDAPFNKRFQSSIAFSYDTSVPEKGNNLLEPFGADTKIKTSSAIPERCSAINRCPLCGGLKEPGIIATVLVPVVVTTVCSSGSSPSSPSTVSCSPDDSLREEDFLAIAKARLLPIPSLIKSPVIFIGLSTPNKSFERITIPSWLVSASFPTFDLLTKVCRTTLPSSLVA